MSAQFGRVSLRGDQARSHYLDKVDSLLAPLGPDGLNRFSGDGIDILHRSFHTTRESRGQSQPVVAASGAVVTWDGRLDNREELIQQLNEVPRGSSDASIVAAAYDYWGIDCLAKLIGDWALSIWKPQDRTVVLARDFIGIRHLYYLVDEAQIIWSSILDPLVLLAGRSFLLSEEYLAGWLGHFPAAHLTPYVGIHSVPPSAYVLFQHGKHTARKYWDFDPNRTIRYQTDADYEEHFRLMFGQAVMRRLRSDSPILAELSGGMDSSAIVCMADELIEHRSVVVPRLDTVSFYDDSEPNWNERPYVARVEEKRGRVGSHIDVASQGDLNFDCNESVFRPTPAAITRVTRSASELTRCMQSGMYRVVLSGIGGDEVTGGVPTPIPELQDDLARCHFRGLAHALKTWALERRTPWFYLLIETASGFCPPIVASLRKSKAPPAWLHRGFAKRNRAALGGYERRITFRGPLPTLQQNLNTLESLRRQLGCSVANRPVTHERRYPYLDRDLLEFLYAIPREQLVRPGQRRSLMRRALVGIVPTEVLQRKRKAFVSRAPLVALSASVPGVNDLTTDMATASTGIVDADVFRRTLGSAQYNSEVPLVPLIRVLITEAWLKGTYARGVCVPGSVVAMDSITSKDSSRTRPRARKTFLQFGQKQINEERG